MLDIVVMTWKGYQPSLPSIVLNSHTDVVPIYPVIKLNNSVVKSF